LGSGGVFIADGAAAVAVREFDELFAQVVTGVTRLEPARLRLTIR
jgi:hypothetical protein